MPNSNPNLYFDNFISPEYWENKFKGTFGIIAFYMEKLALLFSMFLLIKFLMEVVSVIMRAFEIQRLSNRTMHLGKVVFSSIFNVLYITAITNLFREDDDYEDIDTAKGNQNKKPKRLTKVDIMHNSTEQYDVLNVSKLHRQLYPNLNENSTITENIEMNAVQPPKYAKIKPHDYTVVDVERKTDRC